MAVTDWAQELASYRRSQEPGHTVYNAVPGPMLTSDQTRAVRLGQAQKWMNTNAADTSGRGEQSIWNGGAPVGPGNIRSVYKKLFGEDITDDEYMSLITPFHRDAPSDTGQGNLSPSPLPAASRARVPGRRGDVENLGDPFPGVGFRLPDAPESGVGFRLPDAGPGISFPPSGIGVQPRNGVRELQGADQGSVFPFFKFGGGAAYDWLSSLFGVSG